MKPLSTRFAPSPTGYLHLGHAYAALFAWEFAKMTGGRFFLRMEDIDTTRYKKIFEDAIYEDLEWLGITWEKDVLQQSNRGGAYQEALLKLQEQGLLYPCFCTRKEIFQAVKAPHGNPKKHYPKTCKRYTKEEREEFLREGRAYALRLDIQRAQDLLSTQQLNWHDLASGKHRVDLRKMEDVVLARKDIETSYHLAVTIDDAAQGISLITRGEDLAPSTSIHRLLQHFLGFPTPTWCHHKLIEDEKKQRLAKRNSPKSLRDLRAKGATPEEIKKQLAVEKDVRAVLEKL